MSVVLVLLAQTVLVRFRVCSLWFRARVRRAYVLTGIVCPLVACMMRLSRMIALILLRRSLCTSTRVWCGLGSRTAFYMSYILTRTGCPICLFMYLCACVVYSWTTCTRCWTTCPRSGTPPWAGLRRRPTGRTCRRRSRPCRQRSDTCSEHAEFIPRCSSLVVLRTINRVPGYVVYID